MEDVERSAETCASGHLSGVLFSSAAPLREGGNPMRENMSSRPPSEAPPTVAPEHPADSSPVAAAIPSTLRFAPHTPAALSAGIETLPLSPAVVVPPVSNNYQIIGELGRGGMGVVYRARQAGLDREVALKMILSGEFAQPEEVSRFHNEARAVAKLEHLNIIRIYDVGELEGRPYFAMELADGGNLAEKLRSQPLAPLEAAQLVEVLARAMQFAHERGIVHRDLKPVNVLLSSGGREPAVVSSAGGSRPPLAEFVPKITDFGLAKRMDSKGRTMSGNVVGTVNYMAPEQAEGRSRDIGPCTDVYGLGAILYECLTGKPPFQADTLIATLEQVRTREPVAVRQWNPLCPRDLETICLKCLEKEPGRRYDSALSLAEDISRFLNNDPIRARPVSAMERLWRSIQRRKREVIWASSAALTLLVLAGLLLYQAHVRDEERRQAHNEYLHAVEAIREVSALLAHADRPPQALARLLRELPEHYQQVQQNMDDAALKEQAARACAELAEALLNNGRNDEAADAGKQAILLYEGLLRAQPQRGSYRDALAQVHLLQGQIRADSRDYVIAERQFKDALNHLERLTEEEPDNLEYLRHLAEGHHQLGVLYDTRKQRSKAVASYQEGLKIRERLTREEPNNRQFRRDLARSHGYLGDTYLDMGDETRSWQAYDEAERIRRKLAEESDDAESQFQLARSRANEGYYAIAIGKPKRALKAFDDARAIQEELLRKYPRRADYAGDLGWSLLAIAELRLDCDECQPAVRALLERSRSIFADLLARSPEAKSHARNLARSQINLALFHHETDPRQSRAALAEARKILQELNQRDREQRRAEDPDDLYQLALVESLEGSLVGGSGSPLTAEEQLVRRRHAWKAMNQLTLAIHFGYTKATRLERDVIGLRLLWQVDPERMSELVRECRSSKGR
jgi:serine/threonine protein kinase